MNEMITMGFTYKEEYSFDEDYPIDESECLSYFENDVDWLLNDAKVTVFSTEIVSGGDRDYNGRLEFLAEAVVEITLENDERFNSAEQLLGAYLGIYIPTIDYIK